MLLSLSFAVIYTYLVKLEYNDLDLFSKFLILPQLPQKIISALKVVKMTQ